MENRVNFRGELAFLSNMYKTNIYFEGQIWPSAENIYQSFKTNNELERSIFVTMTPQQSKAYWKSAPIRNPSFMVNRLEYMKLALEAKFNQNPFLLSKLCELPDERITETNTWGDTFWGTCNGVGEDHLGKLLKEIKYAALST